MSKLKNNLKEYIDNHQINIAKFENNAGLKRNVLYNILSEKSKNPSLENIIKIADALNRSIDEIIGREEYFKKQIKSNRSHIKYNKTLLSSILEMVNLHIITNNEEDASLSKILYIIEEVYEYSIKTNNEVLDTKFALWMLKNQLAS